VTGGTASNPRRTPTGEARTETRAPRQDALRPTELAAIIDCYAQPGALEASIAWYRSRVRERAALARTPPQELVVAQPSHILRTDRDPVAPPDWAENLAGSFADMALTTVSGVGHFLPWEEPDALLSAVAAAI
jgi:pimeloyl-ACP methyl ester carboxylesterase